MALHSASTPHNVPPVFQTSRLRLRPWRDTDSPRSGEGPDGDSLRFMPDGAQPGPDDFPAWLARRRRDMDTGADVYWCVADLGSDEMLGNVQVFGMGPVDVRFQGELGYWLRPGARGRGVIGEALLPVLAHAFRPVEDGGLGLTRLHAATNSDNYVSQSILRSAGFTQWGPTTRPGGVPTDRCPMARISSCSPLTWSLRSCPRAPVDA